MMGDSDLFAPEVWTAHHPTRGAIKLTIATPEHLRTIDAGWPEIIPDDKDDGKEKDAPKDKEEEKRRDQVKVAQAFAKTDREFKTSMARRIKWLTKRGRLGRKAGSFLERWEASPSKGLLLEIEDEPYARLEKLSKYVLPAEKPLKPGEYTNSRSPRDKPRVQVDVNPLGEIMSAFYKEDKETVLALEPPEDSRSARRFTEMQESPWKGFLYPMIAGTSKAGWAIFVFIVLPFLGRIMDWLLGLLPDFNIPWPSIPLPHIPWPSISLPHIPWPHISWPRIPWPDWDLPSIPLPHITLPNWVVFLIDHPRMWVPIVIGLVVGVTAWRNHRKSERAKNTKRNFAAAQPDTTSSDNTSPVKKSKGSDIAVENDEPSSQPLDSSENPE
ncbi:hypothetical protein [Corynebacterium sp.]|uniref:hypothetical protein n=1 Tax=Corynebacterium sp. TaxID=1720 RepID=UPI0026DB159C|nr:hypothetical protein [Corynebacterium sp.]MDO4914340.1 hypothetical protein [Corynebacterium sp.]